MAVAQLRRKTMVNVLRAWRGMKGSARLVLTGNIHPDLPREDQERVKRQMQDCLYGKGGEVSARMRTAKLGEVYLNLSSKGKQRFLLLLSSEFDVDRDVIRELAGTYLEAEKVDELQMLEGKLQAALRPDRVTLLKQFSALPDGVKFLVDMRADMLPHIKSNKALSGVESDLKRLLSAWFDIGLLDMHRIDWNAPGALLEKLIDYEAVHAIRSWQDLKNRLDSDRRCFAFFHSKMPSEPLIFVEVALVQGMADNVQHLLDENAPSIDPEEADTAIFYSISNAQAGLAGISFGNYLIKRVVDHLRHEFPNLKEFATLSPIPGFRRWLKKAVEEQGVALLEADEIKALGKKEKAQEVLEALTKLEKADDELLKSEAVKTMLKRLCATYLYTQKHPRSTNRALDPVANFHISNGARMEHLNWLADSSRNGIKQSFGMMVNYAYKLDHIDENHEQYVSDGKINASRAVRGLV